MTTGESARREQKWLQDQFQNRPLRSELEEKQETQEMQFRSLGREDPLEQKMATHFRIPACKIPQTEEPGKLQIMGLQKVQYD